MADVDGDAGDDAEYVPPGVGLALGPGPPPAHPAKAKVARTPTAPTRIALHHTRIALPFPNPKATPAKSRPHGIPPSLTSHTATCRSYAQASDFTA